MKFLDGLNSFHMVNFLVIQAGYLPDSWESSSLPGRTTQVKFCWKCDNNIFYLPYSCQCLETELNLEIDGIGHIHGPPLECFQAG